jgi:hypothetical protein
MVALKALHKLFIFDLKISVYIFRTAALKVASTAEQGTL